MKGPVYFMPWRCLVLFRWERCGTSAGIVWPKASSHRSLGQRPSLFYTSFRPYREAVPSHSEGLAAAGGLPWYRVPNADPPTPTGNAVKHLICFFLAEKTPHPALSPSKHGEREQNIERTRWKMLHSVARRGCAVPEECPGACADPFRVESWSAFLSRVGRLRRPTLRYATQPLRGIHSPAFPVLV